MRDVGLCVFCGRPFDRASTGRPRKTCRDACRKAMERERERRRLDGWLGLEERSPLQMLVEASVRDPFA